MEMLKHKNEVKSVINELSYTYHMISKFINTWPAFFCLYPLPNPPTKTSYNFVWKNSNYVSLEKYCF